MEDCLALDRRLADTIDGCEQRHAKRFLQARQPPRHSGFVHVQPGAGASECPAVADGSNDAQIVPIHELCLADFPCACKIAASGLNNPA
jgi:hypothetical protein